MYQRFNVTRNLKKVILGATKALGPIWFSLINFIVSHIECLNTYI